jgi:acetate kinase
MKKLFNRRLNYDDKKIIIAHLGNGASIVAIKNNSSIDTSMGLSPLGGLVMGSRPGDLDPGVILFLLKQGHLSIEELDDLLSKESGLKAISGSSDMQELIKREMDDPQAKEAITVFCYYVKKFIGAYAAAMGGLDLLVFTGGIGENSAIIRERICRDMDFLGIEIDNNRNVNHHDVISVENSKVMVFALKTNEELIIAEHTCALINTKI